MGEPEPPPLLRSRVDDLDLGTVGDGCRGTRRLGPGATLAPAHLVDRAPVREHREVHAQRAAIEVDASGPSAQVREHLLGDVARQLLVADHPPGKPEHRRRVLLVNRPGREFVTGFDAGEQDRVWRVQAGHANTVRRLAAGGHRPFAGPRLTPMGC